MSDSEVIPLSNLKLQRATRDQIIESRKRSFDGFARGTTLDEYLARDDAMDSLPSAVNGRLSIWVLVRRDIDAPDGDFLCACKTFKRDASVILRSQEGVKSVVGYGIASVFTPKANRKRGYASHMMRLLHWVLAPLSSLPISFPSEWGAPPTRYPDFAGDAAFSVLYSDVGPEFYHLAGTLPGCRDGWVVQRPSTTVWDVSKADTEFPSSEVNTPEGWSWLSFSDLNDVWNRETAQIVSELAAHSFADTEDAVFAFHPGRGVADYQVQRLEVYWSKVVPPLHYWGLCSASGETKQLLSTFATWTLDYRPPTVSSLIITRIRATKESFKQLMSLILGLARRYGISEVEVWNLEPSLGDLATEMNGKTFDREEHLPAFKWYGPEDPARVTWAYNEKFPWC